MASVSSAARSQLPQNVRACGSRKLNRAVSRIGLGAMTMAGTYTSGGGLDDAESIRAIHRALDLGVTHIDTAEIYGPFHSEALVGEAIRGRRHHVVVATKFGLVAPSRRGPARTDRS